MHFEIVDDHPLYRVALRGTLADVVAQVDEAGLPGAVRQFADGPSLGDSMVKAHAFEIFRKRGVMSRTRSVIDTAALHLDQPA